MKNLIAAVVSIALAAPLARAQAPASEIDFAGLAKSFLDERCDGQSAAICDVTGVLDRHFARIRLGALEINYPTEFLADKDKPEELKEVLIGIVDLQGAWIDRLTAGTEHGDEAQVDVEAIRTWVDDWKTKTLKKLGKKAGAVSLMDALEAPDEVRAAEERLHALMRDEERIGLAIMGTMQPRIVLSPTRLDFMRWLAYTGELESGRRNELYVDGVDQWTQFWTGWTPILAMEYASWAGFDPKFRSGKSMKSFESTGMVEQITLQAGMALVRYCANRNLDHQDNAIVMNLVIDIVGQINTIDGEGQIGTSGARTRPYSRFIPGGNSEGGTLPKRSATGRNTVVKSQWRKDNGADYFLGALRKGQKDGSKLAGKERKERYKDKTAHFQLKSDRGKYVVSAPFFGEHANAQQYPPQEFLTDYSEFYRAYKSGFYHWLRLFGAGSPETPDESLIKFRELMAGLNEVGNGLTFEQLFENVYGLPLSAADGETDSMEWRFLAFLKDGK